jgi:prefoldin subunit 5
MSSVSDYVSALADVEPTLRRFQEMISKYQFMEANKQKHAQSLREKIPEMKNTLDTVKFLRKQKAKTEKYEVQELETTFPLADTLYAKAVVRPAELEEVYLWLGANVMVAYPLGEAEEMLTGKLETAKESLKAAEEDLEFLRVQITTLEVATARVYNWDVMEKRRLKAEGKLVDEQGAEGEGEGEGDSKGGG